MKRYGEKAAREAIAQGAIVREYDWYTGIGSPRLIIDGEEAGYIVSDLLWKLIREGYLERSRTEYSFREFKASAETSAAEIAANPYGIAACKESLEFYRDACHHDSAWIAADLLHSLDVNGRFFNRRMWDAFDAIFPDFPVSYEVMREIYAVAAASEENDRDAIEHAARNIRAYAEMIAQEEAQEAQEAQEPAEELPSQADDIDAQSDRVQEATRAALARAGMLAQEPAQEPAAAPQEPAATAENIETGEILEGPARAVYGAVRLSLRVARHDGEPEPVWTGAGPVGARAVLAAYAAEAGAAEIRAEEKPAQPAQERDPEEENRAHCRRIAEELDAYADGEVYRCPECSEELHIPGDVGDKYRCPHCGTVSDVDDLEQLSVWDYLADALDVDFIVDRNREYKACRVMVAFGGPTIYIDTGTGYVELYWWNERARYALSSSARDAVDEWAAESWNI